MRNFISYKESIKRINGITLGAIAKEKIFISNAIGRVLADDIIADHNNPNFPMSGMDGYAILHKDIKNNSIKIIDKIPAGSEIESVVVSGVCIKTFTGSLIPEGADTLVPIENVDVIKDCIKVNKEVPKGFQVREIGENYKINEILIKKGTIIGFSEIGVLASLNISQIMVVVNPTVAVASTGSEILDLGEEQTNSAQIRSSNHLTIEALCKSNGANVLQMGTVKDDLDSITLLLEESLKKADIVVTTGGVSVGDYDFVQDVVKDKLKANILFHGVTIKPGMHILVATKDNKIIISLPGFAYSSTVCAILYVLPLIYKYRCANEKLPIVKARMEQTFKRTMPKTRFTACNICYKNNEYFVNFDNKKTGTSAILTNMLNDPALLIQEFDDEDLKINDLADVILLEKLK